MLKYILLLFVLFLCIVPVSAEKNKGLFSGDILQTDLDAFTGNTSEVPSYADKTDGVQIQGKDTQSWIEVGKTQLRNGEWASAEEAFSRVTEMDTLNNDGWEGYLLAIRGSGNFERLLTASEDAAKKNPGFGSLWKYQGIALSGLGRSDEALLAFEKALSTNQSNYQIWYYKGIALDGLKRYDDSIKAYEQVLQINPAYAKAWNNKGVALNYLGRYDEAVSAFEEAMEIDPTLKKASENKEIAIAEKAKNVINSADIIDDAAVIIPSSNTTGDTSTPDISSSPVDELVHEDPVNVPKNRYKVVHSAKISWDRAKAEAEEAGGHLATITSAEENELVYNLIKNDDNIWYNPEDDPIRWWGPWIGGYESSNGYRWVTGEKWEYSNWLPGEPNNNDDKKNCVEFFSDTGHPANTWNDEVADTKNVYGYIIEWESGSNSGLSPDDRSSVSDDLVQPDNQIKPISKYKAVYSPEISWDRAKAEAEEEGGHLATITSAEENELVYNLIKNDDNIWYNPEDDPIRWWGPWIGGYESSDGYRWITGEKWEYSNWLPGEPNNKAETKNCVEFFSDTGNIDDTWNDEVTDTKNVYGYIIEWE